MQDDFLNKKNKFSKKHRLCKKEINQIYLYNKIACLLTFSLYFRKNNIKIARLGLIIPKKNYSKSVDRNKIRRVLKDGFRCKVDSFKGFDLIIVIKDFLCLDVSKFWDRIFELCSHY